MKLVLLAMGELCKPVFHGRHGTTICGLASSRQQATLTEEQVRELYRQGEEAVVFALLELTKRLADARSPSIRPSTPSGMIPLNEKPTKGKRRKTPGAKPGHWAPAASVPNGSTHAKEHRADRCPDCGGRLQRCEKPAPAIPKTFPTSSRK